MLTLDENYSIDTDDTNNCTLKYSCNTGKVHEKSGKEIVTTNEWYFPNIKLCLREYLHQCVKPSQSAKDMFTAIDRAEKIIINLKLTTHA